MDPMWRLTRWPIATIGGAIMASWCVHEFSVVIASLTGGNLPFTKELRVNAPLTEVRERVERALQAKPGEYAGVGGSGREGKGFVIGETGEWWLSTVPEGKSIGAVAFVNAWMESPYDRWHWRRGGLVASNPQVEVHYIASDQPVETKVRIELTWPNAKPKPGEAEALLNRLIAAATTP